MQKKHQIEADFEAGLDWRRMEGKKAGRIVFVWHFERFDRIAWPEKPSRLSEQFWKLAAAFGDPKARLWPLVRTRDEKEC